MRTIHRVAMLLALAAPLAACGSTTSEGSNISGTITVGAATSLGKAFTALVADFESTHPGVSVSLSLASSKELRTNINNAAPIDVFASADWDNMKAVKVALRSPAVEFTTNRLAIVVPPGNPKGITGLSSLAEAGVRVATCSPGVPIRTYTDAMLTSAGLLEKVSANYNNFAANVAGIVTAVVNGGSDAGVVYRTDVLSAGSSVFGVTIPDSENHVAHYPIAELATSTHHAAASAFIEYVNSAAGQAILARFGFGTK